MENRASRRIIVQNRVRSRTRVRRGFISVGAVGQRPVNTILSLMVLALWRLRKITVVALSGVGGISLSVLRRWGRATRRWNSSLRSHRTWRSHCRHVCSGLKKTLFAPVGPNSRCRGHQAANPAGPGSSLEEKQSCLGRINAGRGRRRGGAHLPERDAAKIPPHVNDSSFSPGFFCFGLRNFVFTRQASPVGRLGSISLGSSLVSLPVAHHGLQDSQ